MRRVRLVPLGRPRREIALAQRHERQRDRENRALPRALALRHDDPAVRLHEVPDN